MRRFAAWAINCKKGISGSLTAKTFLILLSLLLVICMAAYIFIGLFLPFSSEGQSRRQLEDKARALVSELRQRKADESGALFVRFIWETGANIGLMNQARKPIDLFTFAASPISGAVSGREYPFRFADSLREYILVAAYNPARSHEISRAIWRSLPWVGSLVLLLSLASAVLFSRYTTRPIIRMSGAAAKIADLDFSWYCPDLRQDEIGLLSKSLNELSDTLSAALSSLKRQNMSLADDIALEKERERRRLLFFSGVSHELKTPIAIVIGQLEGMRAGIGVYKDRETYLARSAEILRSLDGFIKEILSVSHMDIAENSLTAVNLAEIAEECVESRDIRAEPPSIRFAAEIEPDVLIAGDGPLLKKALANVIGNAALYTPDGGAVRVALAQKGRHAVLTVFNSPAHIQAEHLPRLFEAFYRADRHSKHGGGLGLYITRMILEAHKAEYAIANVKDGVQFTISFPLLPVA
ncbi:MAG: HAMP domain-containing histidine kinase [Firmicutes bacterium]|nr:HAMP domain-containing histidine kinase [Bacillota bacterium]